MAQRFNAERGQNTSNCKDSAWLPRIYYSELAITKKIIVHVYLPPEQEMLKRTLYVPAVGSPQPQSIYLSVFACKLSNLFKSAKKLSITITWSIITKNPLSLGSSFCFPLDGCLGCGLRTGQAPSTNFIQQSCISCVVKVDLGLSRLNAAYDHFMGGRG